MASWGEIPDDLLLVLLQRLIGLGNFIRFGAVCRTWHSLVATKERIFAAGYRELPWLMLTKNEETDVRELFDLSTGEVYEVSVPLLSGRRCIGSSYGWVITIGSDLTINMLDPLTGVQVPLPSFSTFQCVGEFPDRFRKETAQEIRNMFIFKAVMSANPSNGEFVVMATHKSYRSLGLSYCNSHDRSWKAFERLDNREVAFFRGSFYSVSTLGKVYVCNISSDKPELMEIASLPVRGFAFYNYYFVECGEDLLVVSRFIDRRASSYRTTDCRVFKVVDLDGKRPNVANAEQVRDELARAEAESYGVVELVDGIGDHALFLGPNNSICVSIPSNKKICKPNCIYLAEDIIEMINLTLSTDGCYKGGNDTVVFNLLDFSMNNIYPGALTPSFSPPIWITPTIRDD